MYDVKFIVVESLIKMSKYCDIVPGNMASATIR